MSARPSPTIVIRRTFDIYVEQAGFLLPAGLAAGFLLALDGIHGSRPLAVGATLLLVSLLGLTLFVSIVVLLVSDVHDGGDRRRLTQFLSSSRRSLGQLLLTVAVGGLALVLVDIFATTVSFGLLFSAVFSGDPDPWAVAIGLLAIPLGLLAPLFLVTAWFVSPAVAVLERPGRARALRLSRSLGRNSRWRVLAVALTVLLPLTLLLNGVERATSHLRGAPLFAVRMLLTTAVAPIPLVAMTVLYFELRRCSGPDPATAENPDTLGPLLPA